VGRAALLGFLPLIVVTGAAAGAAAGDRSPAPASSAAARKQSTKLISRGLHGRRPNGTSAHPVISGDRRFARIISFDSKASNLVHGDHNHTTDVFFIRRRGGINNNGTRWKPGKTRLLSRGLGGGSANGPSYLPSVDGNLDHAPSCIAFLSAASNLVEGVARRARTPPRWPSRATAPGSRS
jgi:hypothetical protein